MTDHIILSFPEKSVSYREIGGKRFVQCDTGLTPDEFIRTMMQYLASGGGTRAVLVKSDAQPE